MVHPRPHPSKAMEDLSQCHCLCQSNQDPLLFLKDHHPSNHPSTSPDLGHLHHQRGQLTDHLLHPRGTPPHPSLKDHHPSNHP